MPLDETVSAGSFAPTYICNSRYTNSLRCRAARDLMDAGGWPFQRQIFVAHVGGGVLGSIVSVIFVDWKIQCCRRPSNRFGQANVLDHSLGTFARNSSTVMPAPIFLRVRKTALGRVDDAQRFRMFDR